MLFSLFSSLLGMRASTVCSLCTLIFSERSGAEMGALLQGGETHLFSETLSTVLLDLGLEQYKDNKTLNPFRVFRFELLNSDLTGDC